MTFAISLCIAFGFTIGLFQLLRLDILDIVWEVITPFTPPNNTSELEQERSSAWVLIISAVPLFLSMVYTQPWTLIDNLVTGRSTALVLEFSALKAAIAIASILAGEVMTSKFKIHEKLNAHVEGYVERNTLEPDPEAFTKKPHDWDEWRRQYAGRGHRDWKPNKQGRAENSSQDSYQGGQQESHVDPTRANALRTLKLSRGATQKQIRKAFIKMAKAHHPDRVLTPHSSDQDKERAEDRMKEINTAYDWLKQNT